MKKQFLFCAALLLALSGCNKPKERSATMNKDAVDKAFAISELGDLTGAKKTVIKTASKDAILAMDDKLTVATTDGKIGDLLKKVKDAGTKAALDGQLTKGAIAIVVLNDQIKIYKVIPADASGTGTVTPPPPVASGTTTVTPPGGSGTTAAAMDEEIASPVADTSVESAAPADLLTFNYLSRLKALAKTSDARAQSDITAGLDAAKNQKPSEIGEKEGFVEITSLKIEKVGILDNERTDYGEKKSTLNVIEAPFEVATHVLVGDEILAKKTGEDGAEQSAAPTE